MIDISNWNDHNIENMEFDIAKEWGLIQIVNHGISIEALSNLGMQLVNSLNCHQLRN